MSEDTKETLSRRGFFTGNFNFDREKANTIQVEGPIQIGQLELSVLPIGHHRHYWERHEDNVKELIRQYPVIIPEYFPLEYQHLKDVPVLGGILRASYDDANYLFEEIALFAHQEGKGVWVIDPAYDEAFLSIGTMEYSAVFGLTVGVVATAAALKKERGLWNRLTTRQQFLVEVGLGTSFLTGTLISLNMFENAKGKGPPLSGTDFRRVVIAEQLKSLSQSDITGNALLIYPPIHWKVIKHYLENDVELRNRANIYNHLKGIPQFEPLFQARHYVPTQESWNLEQKVSLSEK